LFPGITVGSSPDGLSSFYGPVWSSEGVFRETIMTRWIGVAFGAGWLMIAEAVASPPVGPREALESAIVQVVSILQHGEINGTPVGDSSAELRRITREVFDFDEISQRTLAHHWQLRTHEEQAEFVALFRGLLERSYMAQIRAYAGEPITVVGESVEGDLATVRSRLATRGGAEVALDFRMHARPGRWQVYDVLIGGVSLVSSYRSQFERVIQSESYGALRDRLQRKSLDTAVAERQRESK
jgi:phospholipid transport system substrate-binding protein